MARFALLAVLSIAGALGIGVGWHRLREARIAENDAKAVEALHAFPAAEVRFRREDGKFWTRDVAGLPLLSPELAGADPSRPGAKPWHGYWFVAMDQSEDGQTYRQGAGMDRHPSKFGFCAYPAKHGATGRSTFHVDEDGVVVKEDLGGKPRLSWPPDDWPSDAFLKLHYSKIE
jgi:hypothetical protein